MGKKKYTPITDEDVVVEKKVRKPKKTGEGLGYKTLFYVTLGLAVLLLALFTVPSLFGSGSSKETHDEKIHTLLGSSYVELGRKETATDIDSSSNKVVYWTWNDRNGAWGYCTELPIPGFPNVLMVVDSNVKVMGMIETKPIGAGVKRQAEYKDILEKYTGKSLLDFTYIETNIPEGETAKFRGLLRDAAANAMKVLYIEVNGESMFRSNFPQGIKFAKVGSKLEPWSVELHKGGTLSSNQYKGRKYAFLATSSCGSCRNTIINISQRLQNEGRMGTDQIVMIFTSKEEKLHYFEKQMTSEHLVLDISQRGFSSKISLTESTPCIMLIDGEGTVVAKAGSQTLNDADALNKILENYFSAP